MAQTLAELKAENAREEVDASETPQVEEAETETEAIEEETQETEEAAESTEGESEEAEIEDWQRTGEESEDDSSNDEKLFSNGDMASLRRKLKGKLSDEKEENAVLKEEIERLKANPPQAEPTGKPKREDFFQADDPDEAYTNALVDWKINTSTQEARIETQSQARKAALDTAVSNHYDKAAKLIEESKGAISAEAYQANDRKVRLAIDSVFPGMGDAYTDQLISIMEKDSDKVMWQLAVNKGKLNKLVSLLRDDPQGLKASRFIGTLEESIGKALPKASRAPTPPTQINGDATATNVSATAKKLQEKYTKAHKAKDGQAAYNARKEARKAGLDISDW